MTGQLQRCVLVSAIVAGIAWAGTAQAQRQPNVRPSDPPNKPVGIVIDEQQALENERAVTPEVLRRGQPLPMPRLSDDEFRRVFPQGPAPDAPADLTVGPQVRGNVASIPLRWAGRLTTPTGGWCTAQFISSTVILTAGHCVSVGNQFRNNVVFRQQYVNGTFNNRNYPVRCVGGWTGWLNGGSNKWRWDYAMIKVWSASATGWFGSAWNWIRAYTNWHSIGYPAAIDNGQIIQRVYGRKGSFANNVVELIHGVAGFTQGASGGAWVAKYSSTVGANNYAISVNSFIYSNRPGRIYGPYFDTNFRTLFNYVNRGCV